MILTNLTLLVLFSIVYIVGLLCLYFSKSRLNTGENKIYVAMLMSNLIGLFLQLLCDLVSYRYDAIPVFVSDIILRLYLIYFIVWLSLMLLYLIEISFKDKSKNKMRLLAIFGGVVAGIITVVLPYDLYRDIENRIYYTFGSAISVTFICSFIVGTVLFAILILKRKEISRKKTIPIWMFLLLASVAGITQAVHPELVITAAAESLVCCFMYFTIENPDVQLLEELYKNKKLIERTNEDTSNFLFRMTQDIKKPVKDMVELSKDMMSENDKSKLLEDVKIINNSALQIDYLVNDALDVSAMNTKKLKIYDTRYNAVNLFKEIKYRFDDELKDGVKFEMSLDGNIPEYLYGDSIKLKQAILSVLNKSLAHTEKGSITLNVSAIVKYGLCRLIITITDTGEGIGIDEVNEILSLKPADLADIGLDKDSNHLELRAVKKLVGLLGGNLMVKSEVNVGTTVDIVLEQKIVETEKTIISRKLDSYEQSINANKRIMVVDDDAKELAKITSILEKHNANVSGSLFGRDCIEKIGYKHKFDLIILDDETSTYSALEVLKELKKNKKFNIPVVVMIDDNKEFIKLHYLQDGFADCIMKSKLESELERIIKRF